MTSPPHCVASYPDQKPRMVPGPITGGRVEEVNVGSPVFKRKCGCSRTSDKLKHILGTFPSSQPPSPMSGVTYDKACGYNYGHVGKQYKLMYPDCCTGARKFKMGEQPKSWRIVVELVSLVQLSVTATALALYYLIYCYMQLVYYTLRSALYFHNADGPMKITIGVVIVTSLLIAINLLLRMERLIGIFY